MSFSAMITKKLPDFTIDISFTCSAGKMLAMTGPSGAGKTTIMRILAGLERPDSGHICCNGITWLDTAQKKYLPPQKRNLGYVFQEYTLFPHLSVEKNVAFAARRPKKVPELLAALRIGQLRFRMPRQLSGGERQRVALAQALAREPKLLLLDEPFSALDTKTKGKLQQTVDELKERFSLPVIHITHNMEDVMHHADRVLPIEQGMVSKQCSTGAICYNRIKASARPGRSIASAKSAFA